MTKHLPLLFIAFIAAGAQAQVTKLLNNTNMLYGLPLNGKFLMVGSDGSLWATDGTPANTQKFTTKATYNTDTGGIALLNNKLYFAGKTAGGGTELWVTDGTDGGTSLVKDIRSGAAASYPQDFNVINNTIYFSANDGTHGTELWKTDGTPGGTSLLKDVSPGAAGGLDSATYFINGTTLLFTADDGTHGYELWKSDGTPGGTALAKDITAGAGSTQFGEFTPLGGKAIFEITIGNFLTGTEQLWSTDGTTTALVKDFGNFSGVPSSGFVKFNNKLYFAATSFTTTGTELWVTDGTGPNTVIVKDIAPGTASSSPLLLAGAIFPNKFMFTANTAANGFELWESDGTGAGTALVKDINPGSQSSNAFPMANYSSLSTLYNGKVFVIANDGTHGTELWLSDGTGAGTNMVKDVQAGSGSGLASSTTYFYTTQGLYFGADDGTHGMELWKSDGTGAGTAIVKDINSGEGPSSPRIIGLYNNHLYFTADDGDNNNNLRDVYRLDATVTALPIKLLNFTAQPEKSNVLVNWGTAAEINTSTFTIQRSDDGQQFKDVGTMQAAGNSTTEKHYSFIDENALRLNTPVLYYRLQTSDKDGAKSYSTIVPVKTDGSMITVSAYPNPATDFLILNYKAQNNRQATIRVTDASGKVVLSQQLSNTQNNGQASINVKALAPGIYNVQVITDKGTQATRFIKQP